MRKTIHFTWQTHDRTGSNPARYVCEDLPTEQALLKLKWLGERWPLGCGIGIVWCDRAQPGANIKCSVDA